MEQEDINNRLKSLSPIFQRITDPEVELAVGQLLEIIIKQNKIIEAQQQQIIHLHKTVETQQQKIIHLQKTIETQQQKIEVLEEKLKTNSKNSSAPPPGTVLKRKKISQPKIRKKVRSVNRAGKWAEKASLGSCCL